MILGRLSSPIEHMKPHYQVVVVGSGYGGAIAAARLAAAGNRVGVLERGRELRPGDYPASLPAALRNLQLDLPQGHMFSSTGLYDLRVNGDMNVLVGCGLGGTSLINANVMRAPDRQVFTTEDSPWPTAIRTEAANGRLNTYFALATSVLRPAPFPCDEPPRKYRALESVGQWLNDRPRDGRTGVAVERAEVAVRFPENDKDAGFRDNGFGVMQHPCTGCGDCVSGCNYGAKNTVLMNYLPLARSQGAEIFTEAKVTMISQRPDGRGWLVHYELVGSGRRGFLRDATLQVSADTVILAAGALGSTEILLRSRDRGKVPLSMALGRRFSGNGDVLAFAYNGRNAVNGVGAGQGSFHGTEAPGPCISGSLTLTDQQRPVLLQEGVIPGALSPILSVGFLLARVLTGRHPVVAGRRRSFWRLIDDVQRSGVSSTQTFLAMLSDPGEGQLKLVNDRVKVVWAGAGRGEVYDRFARLIAEACASVDAAYVPSPFAPITVHPLGGCAMADHATDGVVNHMGAVFTGREDDEIHRGLYVCDASTIPGALGTNPLFTIAALAERSAAFLTGERTV